MARNEIGPRIDTRSDTNSSTGASSWTIHQKFQARSDKHREDVVLVLAQVLQVAHRPAGGEERQPQDDCDRSSDRGARGGARRSRPERGTRRRTERGTAAPAAWSAPPPRWPPPRARPVRRPRRAPPAARRARRSTRTGPTTRSRTRWLDAAGPRLPRCPPTRASRGGSRPRRQRARSRRAPPAA